MRSKKRASARFFYISHIMPTVGRANAVPPGVNDNA